MRYNDDWDLDSLERLKLEATLGRLVIIAAKDDLVRFPLAHPRWGNHLAKFNQALEEYEADFKIIFYPDEDETLPVDEEGDGSLNCLENDWVD